MADGNGNGIEIPVLTVDTLYITGAINPGPAGSEPWDNTLDNSGTVNGLAAKWVEYGTQTRDYTNNQLFWTGHARGSTQLDPALLLQDAPDNKPYSVIVKVSGPQSGGGHDALSLCFADAIGMIWAVGLSLNDAYLVRYYTVGDLFTGSELILATGQPSSLLLKITDDGTNMIFETSADDGVTWDAQGLESYAAGGMTGAPVSFGLAITTRNSFAVPEASSPTGTFGPVLVVDDNPATISIGDVRSVTNPVTLGNIPVYSEPDGKAIRDSGVPITDILTVEQVQDVVGAMAEGGTQTGILVTYDDAGAAINFEVIPNTRFRSAYDNGTAYEINDIVVDAGVFYICISATTGHVPPNATYWLAWGGSGGGGDTSMDLFNHHADAGNTSTSETDGYSDTLPAGKLANNDDKITVKEFGTSVSSSGTATRQWKKKFAGSTIFDSTALLLSLSGNWSLLTEIIRVSSSIIRYAVTLEIDGAPLPIYKSVGELTGLTLSGTNVLKTTLQAGGAGAATNDIVETMGNIFYVPSGATGFDGGGTDSAGSGMITILPPSYSAINGTWDFGADSNTYFGRYFANISSDADGDYIEYQVYLAPGTYSLMLLSPKNTDGAKVDVYIDATNEGTINLYNGSLIWNQRSAVTGMVVSVGGVKTIRLIVNGKDGSHYFFYFNYAAIWQTA